MNILKVLLITWTERADGDTNNLDFEGITD